jgi:hypothetical protein
MVTFGNSKIYKITSSQSGQIYIGSTTKKYLSQRLVAHKASYKRFTKGCGAKTMSYDILQYDDAQILLLEELPDCKSKDELRAREQEWIEHNKEICVNKHSAHGLDTEKAQARHKAYYVANTEKVKQYQTDNAEHLKATKLEWVKQNPEKIKEYNDKNKEYKKQWYQNKKLLRKNGGNKNGN